LPLLKTQPTEQNCKKIFNFILLIQHYYLFVIIANLFDLTLLIRVENHARVLNPIAVAVVIAIAILQWHRLFLIMQMI